MFGKKKRIIETQKALIADLRTELDFLTMQNNAQKNIIIKQQRELTKLYDMLKPVTDMVKPATDIDFPNSQKGGSDHTGAVNVSDILNL